MKKRKILLTAVFILLAAVFALILVVPQLNYFQRDGILSMSILTEPVRVVRDENGMAYIYAKNLPDALRAQGFVTAQDRLFQMELTRLFAQGRICELAGEKAKQLDTRMRTIGFHRQAKRYAAALDRESRAFIQAYIDGINEYITNRKGTHHLEFTLAGIKPAPWAVEDVVSILYFMGWNMAANINTEIISQMLIEKLGPRRAGEIFPVNVNPDDAGDMARLNARLRQVTPSAVWHFHPERDRTLMSIVNGQMGRYHPGSNNWAVSGSRTKSGKPVVANDPHLDTRMIPGPLYPVGIITPEIRAVGAVVPGMPGILIGRNSHVAFGITNSYGDGQDLYVETLDPRNPGRYMEGNASVPFTVIKETLKIKDSEAPGGFREETISIQATRRGPVVSNVLQGLKTGKVITLRFSPFESKNTKTGLKEILTVRSTEDMKKALKNVTAVMINMVFADTAGNIGWQTTGRLPLRAQKDSTIPYTVKNGADNWKGWIPYGAMPASYNPPGGWVGTCNHKTVSRQYPYYISSYFSPRYRYVRLKELMASKAKLAPEDMWTFQRDIKNILAVKIVPVMAAALKSQPETAKLAAILESWDRSDGKDSAAPLIFQAVYNTFALLTFSDELGEELAKTMLDVQYYWHERFENMVTRDTSKWFDDITTPDKKETRDDLFRLAGKKVMADLSEKLGSDPNDWRWGDVHGIDFFSPLARSGFLKGLFGSGPHPMDGSAETLYRAKFQPSGDYSVTFSAALRMVADLSDNDKVMAVMSCGVSGRQFRTHTTDQIEPYMNGEKRYWWFSDRMIREHGRDVLNLVPGREEK